MRPHRAICVNYDGAVLLHLARVTTSASHDNIDIGLLVEVGLKIAFLTL